MSVFSVEPKEGSSITTPTLDDCCATLGVTLKDEEKEAYRKLLAVFHESAEELMRLPGLVTGPVEAVDEELKSTRL
jgi:amidase